MHLVYVADPMCSWCWGFQPQLEELRVSLPRGTRIEYVMGGLAPDDDAPMNDEMREYVKRAWRLVAQRTGARFNFDFWDQNVPRRSTYPACRAIIAARRQSAEAGIAMFEAIQRAYYLEARNPSDRSTLLALAREVEAIDQGWFEEEIEQPAVYADLSADLVRRVALGVTGFPSLVREDVEHPLVVMRGYDEAGAVRRRLLAPTGS